MTDLRKAAEMALQALCSANPIGHALEDYEYHNKATEALRQALAQPEQEPVCDKDPFYCWSIRCQVGKVCKHTAPTKREWVGLTDEDIFEITERHTKEGGVCDGWIVAVEVQQKLKEKNT